MLRLECLAHAAMAELVDALDSGSSRGNLVDVRVILAANKCIPISIRGSVPPTKVALIANGEIRQTAYFIPKIRACDQIIAVDGGLFYCFQVDIKPDLIIGDLDSATPEILAEFPDVPRLTFPRDKDQTDLELALEHTLVKDATEVTIFGGLGKKIDQTLYNLSLLTRYPGKVVIETEIERLFVVDRTANLECYVGQILSLIPLNGPVKAVTTQGLKWELSDATLDQKSMSISNECLQETVQISVKEGSLLCILHK